MRRIFGCLRIILIFARIPVRTILYAVYTGMAASYLTVCHSEYESRVRNCCHGNFVFKLQIVYPRIIDVVSVLCPV